MGTIRLPVDLTEAEKKTISDDISNAWTKYEEVEAEKKDVTSGYTKELKEIRAHLNTLNTSYKTGTVEREVEVREEKDIFNGVIRTIRLDTGTVVNTRPLEPEERQRDIEDHVLPGGKVMNMKGGDITEEQALADDPEEAESMREDRLAKERESTGEGPKMPVDGDEVEVLPTGDTEWIKVLAKGCKPLSFEADVGGHDYIYDEVNYGVSWRWAPTWSDVHDATAEIEKLATEQAADAAKDPKPRALLQNPRKNGKNGKPKKNQILDGENKEIVIPPEEPVAAAAPDDRAGMCDPHCEIEHVHSQSRTAF